MKRVLPAIFALILVAVMLAGCSASPKDAARKSEEYEVGDLSYVSGVIEGSYLQEAESPAEAPAPNPGAASGNGEIKYGGRKIIRSYEMTIFSADFDNDIEYIINRLSQFGGYAQMSEITGKKPEIYGDAGRNAYMVLRVPAAKVDEFVQGVKGIGTLYSYSDSGDDITEKYYDYDSRLEMQKLQLERLESILDKTDDLSDVIALEERISEVMLEIERLTGMLNKLDALVDYSTVTVSLREENMKHGPTANDSVWSRIGTGFVDSLYGVGTFLINFFVWLISALPIIVLIAAVVVAVFFIIRAIVRTNRRKRQRRDDVDNSKNSEHNGKDGSKNE